LINRRRVDAIGSSIVVSMRMGTFENTNEFINKSSFSTKGGI